VRKGEGKALNGFHKLFTIIIIMANKLLCIFIRLEKERRKTNNAPRLATELSTPQLTVENTSISNCRKKKRLH